MPQRTPGEEKSNPEARQAPKKTFLPFGVGRTQAMGNKGLAAASIGWTLAGCILVGFAAGSWLDGRFGLQLWTPILLLVGVCAGFREMFRTIAQISQDGRKVLPLEPSAATSSPPSTQAKRAAIDRAGQASSEPQVLAAPAQRERLFSVPPPPFLEQQSEPPAELSVEEVKRRLSGQKPEGEEKRDAV